MTEAQEAKLRAGKPRSIWVYSLAAGQLAFTVVVQLVFARLGILLPAYAAPVIAILGSAFLAYRIERRYPAVLNRIMRGHLACRVALLLGAVDMAALFMPGRGPVLGLAIVIVALGTLMIAVSNMIGLQLGYTIAHEKNKRAPKVL